MDNFTSFNLRCRRLEQALSRLTGMLGSLCSELESAFNCPEGWSLTVGLNESPEVNARAARDNSRKVYIIEFSLGLVVWLDGVAVTLATHIDRNFEGASRLPLLLDTSNADWREEFQWRLDRGTKLLPPDCAGSYESFFQKAAVAIFSHEVSHILRGHLDWIRAAVGSTSISERGLRRATSPISVERARYLEFDADLFAGMITAHLALEPPNFLYRWRINTPQETLVETLLGLTLFFVSLEAEQTESASRPPDYPRPILRMILTATYMERIWERHLPDVDFWEVVYTNAFSVIALFEDLYPDVDHFRSLLDRHAQATLTREMNEVSQLMDTLQSDVVRYAFEGDGLWTSPSDDNTTSLV